MADKKKLYSFVQVDDNTPIQKLKITDQLRVLLKQLTTDPANELANEDYATQQILTLKADLSDFLYRATAPVRNGRNKKVTVAIDNKFKPVLYEVLNAPDIKNFYKVRIAEPKIEYDIPYNIMVELTVKEN